jgi:DNA-directed RNA polymerase
VQNELKQPWPDESQSYNYSAYAARKLFQGIAATVPAADSAMKWLRSIAQQMPNGKRMQWRTPTGFLVQHDYQDYKDVRIRIDSCGVSMMIVREFQEGTRPHSMQNAISPNFVHAMDASHLTLTALRMKKNGLDVVAIHDSFGTHPCDVPKMHTNIRESFVELYDNRPVLGEFLWEVGGVGDPPIRGNLDLNAVLTSEFFFC